MVIFVYVLGKTHCSGRFVSGYSTVEHVHFLWTCSCLSVSNTILFGSEEKCFTMASPWLYYMDFTTQLLNRCGRDSLTRCPRSISSTVPEAPHRCMGNTSSTDAACSQPSAPAAVVSVHASAVPVSRPTHVPAETSSCSHSPLQQDIVHQQHEDVLLDSGMDEDKYTSPL